MEEEIKRILRTRKINCLMEEEIKHILKTRKINIVLWTSLIHKEN